MQNYPGFQNQMMSPSPQYPTPMYNQPYMDRIPQSQAQPQNFPFLQHNLSPQWQQNILGRVVEDFNEITANDVPMDGRSAVFPKRDLSEIQVRTWGNDGKIISTSYKPIQEAPEQKNEDFSNINGLKLELSEEASKEFMRRFDEIANRLDKMEKSMTKQSSSRNKKEADTE